MINQNFVIDRVCSDIIDVYSYNNHIIQIRGRYIQLNTSYLNYTNTTSRHFTEGLGKSISDKLQLDTIISGYNKIKRYLKLNPKNSPSYGNPSSLEYKLKSYIESLGYTFLVDKLDKIWLVIKL